MLYRYKNMHVCRNWCIVRHVTIVSGIMYFKRKETSALPFLPRCCRQEVSGQFVTDILVPRRATPLIIVLPSINKHCSLFFLPCEAAHGGVCFAAVVMCLRRIKEPWAPTVLLLDRCVSLLLVSWCAGLCHAAKLNTAPARCWRWKPWLVVTLSSWVPNTSFKTVGVSLLVSWAKFCPRLGWTALFHHNNWQQCFFSVVVFARQIACFSETPEA